MFKYYQLTRELERLFLKLLSIIFHSSLLVTNSTATLAYNMFCGDWDSWDYSWDYDPTKLQVTLGI